MWLIIVTALGLGVGLAMDACAVSMSNGLREPKMKIGKILTIAAFFGVFQMGMPIIGYLALTVLNNILGEKFTTVFSYFIPWIALILLLYLGIKMLVDGFKSSDPCKKCDNYSICNEHCDKKKESEESSGKTLTIKELFVQAIATAIDALSVGIIFAEKAPLEAYLSFLIIGVVTFIISVAAVFIGKKFGTIFSNKATIAGGFILIAIGLEIFFTNFNDVKEGLIQLFNLF